MERKVFRGIGAAVASVTNDRVFNVMPIIRNGKKVDFADKKRLLDIDLNMTPTLALRWADVRFDDRGITAKGAPLPPVMSPKEFRGFAATSLGSGPLGAHVPDELPRGCYVGGVYIEDSQFTIWLPKINDDAADPWPTKGWAKYELTTIHYSKDPSNGAFAGKRYAGFRGRVKKRAGTLAQIDLLRAGSHLGLPPVVIGTWWFDQGSPEECDPDAPNDGEPMLDVTSIAGADGAIYLELGLLAALVVAGPKIPIGLA
jgi:hypothetical protein